VLFVDARQTFRKIDLRTRDFTEVQPRVLANLVRLSHAVKGRDETAGSVLKERFRRGSAPTLPARDGQRPGPAF
jgi:hypothetical protein